MALRDIVLGVALVFIIFSCSLSWNVVTEEADGEYSGRHHAANFDTCSILLVWALGAVVVNADSSGVQNGCLLFATGLIFHLVTGFGADFSTMPWTSLGGINMLRVWVALPDGWDGVADNTPTWARKYFAAAVLAYFGLFLSFLAMMQFETPPPPLNRSRARKLNNLKQIFAGVSFFAGVVGCICLGSSTLATAPDGEPYRVNGPMYTPSISAQYHEHVYGKYAKSPAGITEGEAYFEVMSIMGVTLMLVLLTLALMTSSNHMMSSGVLMAAGFFGWNMLGRMFYLRWQLVGAIDDSELATLTTGHVFCWLCAVATAVCSTIELMLQTQSPFKRNSVAVNGSLGALPLSKPLPNILPQSDNGDGDDTSQPVVDYDNLETTGAVVTQSAENDDGDPFA